METIVIYQNNGQILEIESRPENSILSRSAMSNALHTLIVENNQKPIRAVAFQQDKNNGTLINIVKLAERN